LTISGRSITVLMISMKDKHLTERQNQLLGFIRKFQSDFGAAPTLREIAEFFQFKSINAARDHLKALCKKGYIKCMSNKARSIKIVGLTDHENSKLVNIPVFGTIPAGYPDLREQDVSHFISVDIDTIGIRPTARTFALRVSGDSMINKHIIDGDYVILEHGLTPKPGDVVAALIDNQSTLKTFVIHNGKPCLKAENPKYPRIIPAEELVIQGVMVALFRKIKQ